MRFVGYWQKRKEVFGPDKFTMRMTLSEALKDDIIALETGVYTLLPLRDVSGRQLILGAPAKHTGDGYTSDSLVSSSCSSLLLFPLYLLTNFYQS